MTGRSTAAVLSAGLMWLGCGAASTPPETVDAPMPAPLGDIDLPAGWVALPGGVFEMGSGIAPPNAEEREHQVMITRHFAIRAFEVTQAEWIEVMGTDPAYFGECGDSCPVEQVSFWDALAFLNAMSERDGLEPCYDMSSCLGTPGGGCADDSGYCEGDYACGDVAFAGLTCTGYRLPTEAEWEYAARAATTDDTWEGPVVAEELYRAPVLDELAWYGGNSGVEYIDGAWCDTWEGRDPLAPQQCGTHPVASLAPNPWGLYDTLGNVREWVWDGFGAYIADPAIDPTGPIMPAMRVHRGGDWSAFARDVRVSQRDAADPSSRIRTVGFRVARTLR